MKLEVGMYVRTIYGIKKIDSISCEEDIRFDNINGFDEAEKLIHNCNGIKYQHYFWYEIVIGNPSFNIIDLIEEGDYVNGYAVIEKPYSYHDIKFISVDTKDSWSYGEGEMPCSEIKSIVTKEQFESMSYKL